MPSKSSWRYLNEENRIQINRISNLFSKDKVIEEGNENQGKISLFSKKETDEIWKQECTIEISWEKKNPENYHQGLKVKETISMFSAIEVIATKKENRWHRSHELTIWWGHRQQVMRRRFYPSKIIHGIFFCELTSRVFEIHAICLASAYKKYEKHIMNLLDSLQCHGS